MSLCFRRCQTIKINGTEHRGAGGGSGGDDDDGAGFTHLASKPDRLIRVRAISAEFGCELDKCGLNKHMYMYRTKNDGMTGLGGNEVDVWWCDL